MTLHKSLTLSGLLSSSGGWWGGERQSSSCWVLGVLGKLRPYHTWAASGTFSSFPKRWDPLESDDCPLQTTIGRIETIKREAGLWLRGTSEKKKKKQLANGIITCQVSRSGAIIWDISSLFAEAIRTWRLGIVFQSLPSWY